MERKAPSKEKARPAASKKAKEPAKAEKAKPVEGASIVVVRIRGRRTTPWRTEHTMLLMNLSRKFHCAILPNDAIARGMAGQAKDFIAFGPASARTVEELFEKRGLCADGGKLTDDYLKSSKSGFSSVKELAAAVQSGSARLSRVRQVKPIFRLSPPRKGFGSIKAAFPAGALGRRGEKEMDALIASMI